MMSSVIPARLEFQCGHAALVSLPRVKGESPAQRSSRIAREKSAAQARSCDFCPPPVAVAEVAQAMVVVAAQPEPVALPVVLEAPVAAAASSTNTAPRPIRPVGRPRRTAAAAAHNRAGVTGHRFVVRFRTETVLQASDIRDALRQAESLGAVDVLGLAAIG